MSGALAMALLRRRLPGLLAWVMGLVLYEWLLAALYPSLGRSPAYGHLIATLPPALLHAFGLSAGRPSFGTFMAGEVFSLVWALALAYRVADAGASLIAGLMERGPLQLILSLPLSRRAFIATAALLVLVEAAGLVVGSVGGLWLLAAAYHLPLAGRGVVVLAAEGFALLASVGAVALLGSAAASAERAALSWAMAWVTIEYVANLAASLDTHLHWAAHLSVFSDFQAKAALAASSWHPVALTGGPLVVAAAALAGAAWWFNQRQLAI